MKKQINNISIKILNLVPKGKRQECGHLLDELINECEEAFTVRTLKNRFDIGGESTYHSEEEE